MEMIKSLTLAEAQEQGWDVTTERIPQPIDYAEIWDFYDKTNEDDPTRIYGRVNNTVLTLLTGYTFDGTNGYNVPGFEGGLYTPNFPTDTNPYNSLTQLNYANVNELFVLGRILDDKQDAKASHLIDGSIELYYVKNGDVYFGRAPQQTVPNEPVKHFYRDPAMNVTALKVGGYNNNGEGDGSRVVYDIRLVKQVLTTEQREAIKAEMLQRYEEKVGKPYE